MSLLLQYVIVALLVTAAAWSAWRILRGRRVLGRGRKSEVDPGSCSSCGSAEQHRKHHQ